MEDQLHMIKASAPRIPWNKGKMTGSKPPGRTKNVWSIRTKLQVDGRLRDLAVFNLAIDSKLRACDVVALKVEDIAAQGPLSIVRPYGKGKPDILFDSPDGADTRGD